MPLLGIALAGAFLLVGVGTLRAENSGVFKSSADISKAQEILVGEGYLSPDSFQPGAIDEATRRGLSSYQSAHALNDRGDLDDETFQSLTSHETAYPWDAEKTAAQSAQPVEPESAPRIAQAPPVPEATPAPAQVKEAPQPAVHPASPAPAQAAAGPATRMPATGSPLPTLLISGLALLGAGALLVRRTIA